jgi:Zn-dependent protease with chaperone function
VPDAAGGFFLFLLIESFAARALLGSLVAALLVVAMLRHNAVRGVSGRRLLLLVPFSVAALLAVASLNRGFLPAVWFDTDRNGPGSLIYVLGDIQIIGGTVNFVVAGYLLIVGLLVTRRLAGFVATTRLRAHSAMASPAIRRRAFRIAIASGVTPPEVRLRRDCPGGAFTTGVRRPWIALDPELARTLDDNELDALLAHEMAHIRLRDPMLCLLTGVCRDLVFFLPGIHLASFWLRREQEEAADDLAAGCTHRPAALASSILKVWEAQAGRMHLASACAAVAPARRWRSLLPARRSRRDGEQPHALVRVQRLIKPLAVSGHPSQRRELGLPFTVLMLAVTIGVLIPAWTTRVFNDGLLLRVFSSPAAAQVESPAFATFRALAPRETGPQRAVPTLPADDVDPLCPCVESPAELRAGRPAGTTATSSQLVWSSDGREAWEVQSIDEKARFLVSQNLLSWHGGQREVGFFTVSRNTGAPPAAASRSRW